MKPLRPCVLITQTHKYAHTNRTVHSNLVNDVMALCRHIMINVCEWMCVSPGQEVCLFHATAASCARGVFHRFNQFGRGTVPTGSERGQDTLHIALCKERNRKKGKNEATCSTHTCVFPGSLKKTLCKSITSEICIPNSISDKQDAVC